MIMRMRIPKQGACDPIAPLELPHSLHAFHRVSKTDKLNMVSLSISCTLLDRAFLSVTFLGFPLHNLFTEMFGVVL